MYENSSNQGRGAGGARTDRSMTIVQHSKNAQDLTSIIKPEYLDNIDENQIINALPTEVKTKMIAHTMACTSMAFNPLGDILATGSADKTVKLWSLKKQKVTEIAQLKSKQAICTLAFSLDNEHLCAA